MRRSRVQIARPVRRSLAVLLLILLSAIEVRRGLAAEESTDEAIRARMALTRQHREALLGIRKQLNQQLQELELQQAGLSRKLTDFERQITEKSKKIRQIKEQSAELERRTAVQQAHLAEQSRVAHAIGRKDWIKLLLNQEDASHLARVLAFYGYLGRARSEVVRQIEGELVQLQALERELNDEISARTALRKQMQAEKAAMNDSTQARRQLLKSWDRTLKEQAEQLQEDQRQLDVLLHAMSEGTFAESVQSMPLTVKARYCPPQGPLMARFGSSRMTGNWDGLLIGGKEGSPVKAAASGRVVFADWFRGYGLLLILDHGQGVMSLYAFNRTLDRSKGDVVAAGDVIATLGSTGGRDQAGLYFGVRDQGRPVDPLVWCKHNH